MERKSLLLLVVTVLGAATGAALHDPEAKMLPLRVETEGTKSTNDVLRHIGMTRVKSPPFHRKRLASQSRKSHSADSHMYVIKLPPNPYYYEDPYKQVKDFNHPNNINKIPLSFKSNGKPGKIYHFNLPVVKKMAARKASKGTNSLVFEPNLWHEDHSASDRKVSYYKPKPPGKEPSLHKYFPGNGKPHALYVIHGKGKKNGRHEQKRNKQ